MSKLSVISKLLTVQHNFVNMYSKCQFNDTSAGKDFNTF